MRIKSKDELLVKSFVQTVSSATTFNKRYKKVCRLLEMRPKLTEEQWLRVWRGLYYCIWYSEMTKGCDIMAQKIGQNEDLSMLLTGFKSLTNDWFGIDAFRLDKYMYLIRIMINTAIKIQVKQLVDNKSQTVSTEESIDPTNDNQKDINEVEAIAEESIPEEQKTSDNEETEIKGSKKLKNKSKKRFNKRKDNSKKEIEFDIEFKAKLIDNILMTVKSSIGLTLHVSDIFIDELVKVLNEVRPKPKADQKIELYFNILLPFVKLMALTEDYRISNGVKHDVFDKFKKEVLISESIDTRKQVLQKMMDAMLVIGGNESIAKRNRDSIYDLITIFKTKLNQLNTTNDSTNGVKRKKILIGKGRHKKVKYQLTTNTPFVTSIVPIAVV